MSALADPALVGATRYACERCQHCAPFPDIAFSPIGHARCTDPTACELRQLSARSLSKPSTANANA